MKLQDIQKAYEIVEKIKVLDACIEAINKKAQLILNSETTASFSLAMNIIEVEQKEVTMSFGMPSQALEDFMKGLDKLANPQPRGFFSTTGTISESKTIPDPDKLKFDLTESESLEILGLLLGKKQRERKELIDYLAEFGVVI